MFWETELYDIYDIEQGCTSRGNMRIVLVMLCVCQQAMTYKLDFQQERSDREKVIGRFDEEREALQADIAKLHAQLAAVKEHDR